MLRFLVDFKATDDGGLAPAGVPNKSRFVGVGKRTTQKDA